MSLQLKILKKSLREEIEPTEEKVDILLRPVQEFDITPKDVSIKFSSTEDELIDIVPVTQLQYEMAAESDNLTVLPYKNKFSSPNAWLFRSS